MIVVLRQITGDHYRNFTSFLNSYFEVLLAATPGR
jgi:hypothetical protein